MGVKSLGVLKFPLEADATKEKRTAYFSDNDTLVLVDENGDLHSFAYKSELTGGSGGGSFHYVEQEEPVHLGNLEYEFPHEFLGLQIFLKGLLMREGASHDYIVTGPKKIKFVRADLVAKLPADPLSLDWNLLGYYRYLPS
jgi:hypothetical protein